MGSSSEQLYLLEVLVDKIFIPNNDNFNISVKVVFGDVGTFIISHEGSRQAPRAVPDNPSRIEFSTGKSLLFPMRPAVLLSEFDNSPLAVYVIHESDNIGFTIIQWDVSFYQTVEQSRQDHNGTITPNLVKKSFVLKHPIVSDIVVGEITLLIRLSCLGTNIMTQFQLVPGLNEQDSSFVFRSNSGSSMVNSKKPPSNVLNSSTDAVPVLPVYSDVLDSTLGDPGSSLQGADSLTQPLPNDNAPDESVEQSEAPPMPLDNSVEKTTLKADEIVPKKIKGPCGNAECPIAMKIKKFLDSNPVGFEPNKSFINSPSEVSKEEKQDIESTSSLPLTNKSFSAELTDINNLFPFPPTRKYEPLTYFAQKCCGNCAPDLCAKDMVHTPYCPARKHVPSCALSDKGSRCKLCPECGGYTESGKTCLEHTMKASVKMAPDFKPANTAEDNVQEIYKCELPRKTEPIRNCCVNRLPGWMFTCQGGSCKKVVKKMECASAPESTPREPCYPVPHCMQYAFNPCERPKCLKDMPRSHFPCFMPPCLASQAPPAKSKKSKRGRSRSIPDDSQENPEGSAKRKKKRKKCDAKCPVRMKMFYERINLKAHKVCADEEAGRIPANMGWRWNGHPDFSTKVNNGWRPGAVPKKVYEIMSKFKSTNEESPEEVAARFKDKKEKAIQAAESRATLQVSKKDNTVTVNFLTLPPELNAAGINISEFNPLTFEIMDDGQLKRTSSVISKSVLKKDMKDPEGNMYFNVQSALTDMCELLKNSTIVEPFKTLSDQEASKEDTQDITLVRKASVAKELEECKSVFNIKMTPRKMLQKQTPAKPETKTTDTQSNKDTNYEEIKLQVPGVVQRLPSTQTLNKKPIVATPTYRYNRPGTSYLHGLSSPRNNISLSPRTPKETIHNIAKQTKTVKK